MPRFTATLGPQGYPGVIHLWDTKSWKRGDTLKHSNEVLCLTFDSTNRLAAGAWDGTVKVWER